MLLPVSAAAAPSDTTNTLTRMAPEKAELLRLLNSDSVTEQERAVRHINTYAHTGRREADFFTLMVPPLHELVRNGDSEAVRIMAVSALSSIGTDEAMRGLQAQVDDIESARVQRITQNAIATYQSAQIAAKKR